MVGAVIVHNDIIIGEGYHQKLGGPHAEVNAINSVKNKSLLKSSTIFVSLEPCSHFGKTPPCSDLIIEHQIPSVVIASVDSNAVVCGNGIKKLIDAGIKVVTGVLENESNRLNKYFNTFHQKKRPFIILKWAETSDGFIDHFRINKSTKALKISNSSTSRWVHQLRAEVDAILVGRNTVLSDNPSLSTRLVDGKSPIRIIIDTQLSLPRNLNVFDGSVQTLIFNYKKNAEQNNLKYVKLDSSKDLINQLLRHLWSINIQSVLVEGGTYTLQKFIDHKMFDQVFRIKSVKKISAGISAPKIQHNVKETIPFQEDTIIYYE